MISQTAFKSRLCWFAAVPLVLLMICGFTPLIHAEETTLRFEVWPMVIDVTFDRNRLTVEDVNRWMQLRDLISNENGFQVPFVLEQCFKDDPRYDSCGEGPTSININNARLNLDKIRTLIDRLDPKRFPTDLLPVVRYLTQIQEFALWKETQRLAFFQTGNASQLETPFQNINPKASCGVALARIHGATDKEQALQLVRHDWANCVWAEERKQLGPYPQKAWEIFLVAHGIREHVFQTEVQ